MKGSIITFLIITVSFQGLSRQSPYAYSEIFKRKVIKAGIDSTLLKVDDFTIRLNDSIKSDKKIKIKYLGCGGFYIGDHYSGLMIDPYFSHFSMGQILFKRMNTIPGNVEKGLRSVKKDIYDRVEGVFAAHAHYDHLMDIPHIFENYLNPENKPKVYSSETGARISRTFLDPDESIVSFPKADSLGQVLDTIYLNNRRIRVFPISTNHAPHFLFLKFAGAKLKDRHIRKFEQHNYSRGSWWKEGENYAFLIDFLDDQGKKELRIYLQSSASSGRGGFLPPEMLDEDQEKIDLLILGGASFHNVKNYPDGLYNNLGSPEKLIICHWEDFFSDYRHPWRKQVTATKIHKLILHVHDKLLPWKEDGKEQFFLPIPGIHIDVQY